jgi:hypothetical protein
MRTLAVMAVLTLSAVSAGADLAIEDMKACHGPIGPERKDLTFYPFDELFFRYKVVGAKIEDGKVDLSETVRLLDPKGKEVLKKNLDLKGLLPLGGTTMPAMTNINVGSTLPAGEYTLQIAVKDNLGGKTVTVEKKLTAKPAEFTLLAPRFSYDARGVSPAPCGGLVGQQLFFRVRAIGLDTTRKEIDSVMHIQVLDKAGKEMLPKPIAVELKNDDPDTVKKAKVINLNGSVALNRAGTFTLRISFTDRLQKKTATFEAPLVVREP